MTRRGKVPARLAIEALRSGVPNDEAIRRLGSPDADVERSFRVLLDTPNQPGFVVAGEFGTGKSHLLGYLRQMALLRNYAVSIVTVSKETPLSISGVVFAAAVRDARMQGVNDDAAAYCLTRIEGIQGAIHDLAEWASNPDAALSPIFAAILHLLHRQMQPDLRQAIEAFLSGGKPPLAALRKALGHAGARGMFDLAAVKPAELVRQRLRFLPRLFQAAGFTGWVVMLDEVELIGRYSPAQRALAYAELAQWLGLDGAPQLDGVRAIAAISADFTAEVINAKQDDEKLPERLRLRGTPHLAELATRAMAAIQQPMALPKLDDAVLTRNERIVRACYTEAYDWQAPAAEIQPRQANKTMRHHIRGWVMQWDMLRLKGIHAPVTADPFRSDYTENDDLTQAPEGFENPE